MKYRLLKFSLLSIMLMLLGGTSYAGGDFKDFAVIVNNQEGTLLTAEEQVQGTAVSFGVAVADNGTVSRVAAGIVTLHPSTFTLHQKTYNLRGQLVGDDYKGIVVRNGKKYYQQ